jgi:hypothetical protein
MRRKIKQIEKGKRIFSRRDQNTFDSPRKTWPINKNTCSLARVHQDGVIIEKPIVINQHDKTMDRLKV